MIVTGRRPLWPIRLCDWYIFTGPITILMFVAPAGGAPFLWTVKNLPAHELIVFLKPPSRMPSVQATSEPAVMLFQASVA